MGSLFDTPSPPPPAPVKTPEQIKADAESERRKQTTAAKSAIATDRRRATVENVTTTGLYIPGVSGG